MTMAAISGTFNLCDPDEARLEDNLHRLEVLAAACRWLDTRIITLCTGTRDPDDMWKWHPENVRKSTWETLIQSMQRAVQIADRHEVTLAFEPETSQRGQFGRQGSEAARRDRLAVAQGRDRSRELDSSRRLSRMTEIFDEAFDWLGPDIVLAHAKNPT